MVEGAKEILENPVLSRVIAAGMVLLAPVLLLFGWTFGDIRAAARIAFCSHDFLWTARAKQVANVPDDIQ